MRAAAFGIAAGILVFHLALATRTTLWDRDEPRFAVAAVQMARSGQYLYPTFGGEVRAQKPILVYWLMSLSIAALGVSELSVRGWSALGLAVTALATFEIGRRLASPRAALIAMAIVAANPLAAVEGTAATTDAVLVALIATGVAAFAWRITSSARLVPVAAFTLAVAGGLLAKAPVGLLPVPIAAAALWSRRRERETRAHAAEFAGASVVAAALFALWWIPANQATGGRLFSEGVLHDIIGRVWAPQEGHGGNPILWLPFYPVVIVPSFAPWSAYLPAALRDVWRRRSGGDLPVILAWWIGAPLVAFSVAATHLPHYVLPMWPALALATAMTIDGALVGRMDPSGARYLRRGLAFTAITTVAAFVTIVVVSSVLDSPALMWLAAPALVVLVVSAAAFGILQARSRYAHAYVAALAGAILFEAALGFIWLPAIDRVKPVPRLAREIRTRASRDAPVATFDFDEPSLAFYLETTPDRLAHAADVSRWAHTAGAGVLVTTREAMAALGPLPLEELGSAAGINVADGRRVELMALARR